MKSTLILPVALALLAGCGGGNDDSATAPAADTAAADTAASADATTAPGATAAAGTAADAGATGATGEIMPGGAIDVLQREGWRVTPVDTTPR